LSPHLSCQCRLGFPNPMQTRLLVRNPLGHDPRCARGLFALLVLIDRLGPLEPLATE
jgi:hypothetical protein